MLAFLDKIPYGTPTLRRVAFWLLTVFILYVLAGFFILPPVAKSILMDQLSTELKRPTTIERIYFNPLTFHVEMEGFRVAKKDGEGDFITASFMSAAPSLASITELAPVIDYLQIRDLIVDVTFYGEGRYSITDLMGSKREPETPEEKAEQVPVFPFALYGYDMTNAKIIFDDRPHDTKHVITDINLRIPFTSSIQDKRKEFTQPTLSAVINGDPIELKGRSLPFDDSLLTEFQLRAVDVDLEQYWTYVPISSALKLVKGRFTSNLSLFFERPKGQRMRLYLGGGGKLTDLELTTPKENTVCSLKKLGFEMERFSLGDNELVLNRLELDTPYVKLIRGEDNVLNWQRYFPIADASNESTSDPTASAPDATQETTPAPEQTPDATPAAPFRVDTRSIRISNGTVDWQDKAIPGGFSRTLTPLEFQADNFSTARDAVIDFAISIGEKERFAAKGKATVTPLNVQGTVEASGVEIPTYAPYLEALPLEIRSGTVGMSAAFQVAGTPSGQDITVDNGNVTVTDLAVFTPKADKPSLTLKSLTVSGTSMDLSDRTVTVNRVELAEPSVRASRDSQGRVDLALAFTEDKPDATTSEAAEQAPTSDGTEDEAPWTATVNQIRLTDGSVHFNDRAFKRPASFSLSGLRVDIDNVSTRKDTTAKYDIAAQWSGGGTIAATGNLAMDTLASNGQIKIGQLGLKPFDPLLDEFSELLLAEGALSATLGYDFSGTADVKYSAEGDVLLTDFQLKDNWGDGEFAGIDSVRLDTLRFANDPFRLAIANIVLDGPRAEVVINKENRLNIKRAFRIADPAPAEQGNENATNARKADTTPKEAPAPDTKTDPLFSAIDIGKITVRNGRVGFRDASIHPPFQTALTNMKLDLSDIAQTREARPKLDFSAKIGPAPMTVKGVANPVVDPIYTDLTISVSGLEMVPLSPYTIKNLGYPLERGRLNADVSLKIEDKSLDAMNRFFIEQLVLGPKDKRPDAPNIPIKFGLALLQDGNGDLTLNLPIQGNLDDPNFRIGGIIFKAIASLFIKALASPFSLIGSMFGGGEQMDFVAFDPGSYAIPASGEGKLDTLIKALTERQKLTLEVDGVVDMEADRQGLLESRFNRKLKQAKFDTLTRGAQAATTVDDMRVLPSEFEDMLYEVYADEPDPEDIKPTTFFVTDRQPVSVMEKFVKDRIQVTDEDLKELARLRAAAVKEYLTTKAPSLINRIYLIDRDTDADKKKGIPGYRVDLGLK